MVILCPCDALSSVKPELMFSLKTNAAHMLHLDVLGTTHVAAYVRSSLEFLVLLVVYGILVPLLMSFVLYLHLMRI